MLKSMCAYKYIYIYTYISLMDIYTHIPRDICIYIRKYIDVRIYIYIYTEIYDI